jgi:hypothetical protein
MSEMRNRLCVVIALTVAFVVMSGFAGTVARASSGTSSKLITGIENPVDVARTQGGGNEITRTWISPANGTFHQWLENDGLKSVKIYTFDITSGHPITCSTSLITFSETNAYPTGTAQLGDFGVLKDHIYKWTFSPKGHVGTDAQYFWTLENSMVPPMLHDSFPGSTLTGWTTFDSNPGGYVGTTSTQSVSQPYSLEVMKSENSTGYAYAVHTFATMTSGTIFVQAWMMVDSYCPAPAYFYVAGSRVTFGFWDGILQWYNDSDGWHALQAFSPGTWYLISFTINIDTGIYNIGIQQQGGTLTTYNDCYVRYGAPYTMDSVTFRAGWIDLPGAVNMYVDDVYVSQVLP